MPDQLTSLPALGTTSSGRRLKRLASTSRGAVDRARTGQEAMSEEAWELDQASRQEILARSADVAAAIERAGGTAFRRAPELTEINLVTLKERAVPRGFRNNNFIPAVMMLNTRHVRQELGVYVSEHQVSGSTVVLGCGLHAMEDLDRIIASMSRTVSRIADHIASKFKVDVIFANTEVKAHRTASGKLAFHVHCHVIIDHNRLPSPRFAALVEDIKQRAPSNYARVEPFKAGDSAQSLVRYCIAPELFINVGMTDCEALALSKAVHGKKFYRPLGGFKTWRRQLRRITKPIFVLPNPADIHRFSFDEDGNVRERPRRAPVVADLGNGCRKDILEILRNARRAASRYDAATGNVGRETRNRILMEALGARLDEPSLKEMMRCAIRLTRMHGVEAAIGRPCRRLAILLRLARLIHERLIDKPRTRSVKTAERVVTLKEDTGREVAVRFAASTPKPVRFEAFKTTVKDVVVHHATAAPRETRRMAPAILVAFRSECSPLALLKMKNLVQDHLKGAALWNARCAPSERVAIAPELIARALVIDGHRVGCMTNGTWMASDGAAYRSECIGGRVYVFDVPAEKKLVGAAASSAYKGLMTHLYTTTAPPQRGSNGPSPRGGALLTGPRKPPIPTRLSAAA